jgi:hypothetical protein
MGTKHALANIKVTIEDVYDRYPDLDYQIASHITKWRDSVSVGTIVTVAEMMNFEAPGSHGLPVEAVLGHVFPQQGPCRIEGVRGFTMQLSPEEIEAGYAPLKFVQRVL